MIFEIANDPKKREASEKLDQATLASAMPTPAEPAESAKSDGEAPNEEDDMPF